MNVSIAHVRLSKTHQNQTYNSFPLYVSFFIKKNEIQNKNEIMKLKTTLLKYKRNNKITRPLLVG